MKAAGLPLAATIVLLFPMIYFFFASFAFFLARLSDPVVTRLLRGLFDTYFLATVACLAFALLAFLSADRPDIATAAALLATLALFARRWFLHHLDTQIRARDTGNPRATHHLRRLQLGGMAYNAAQIALIIASIPRVFSGP